MLNGNFFSTPKTRLEVYKNCVEKFGAALQPLLVINAIGKLTRQHAKPKLGNGENTDMARATLVKLVH